MNRGTSKAEKKQASEMETRCWRFLQPLLAELQKRLDRRLVKTVLDLVLVIVMHRHRNNGLLLSELGEHLMGSDRGPAGVKRIASVLHSSRWGSQVILKYLWKQAQTKVQELLQSGQEAYVIWDESVLEKSESLKAEGLCAVRSSKAARLKRIKPGYFNPPTDRPIFVPSFNWLQIVVTGMQSLPVLAHLCWWTTRGEDASKKRVEEGNILKKAANLWGRRVIHLWDRGFAGAPWTTLALDHGLRFIVRWNNNYHVIGADGRKHEAWKVVRGKPFMELPHDLGCSQTLPT
jgi:hypothetical protein